MPITPEYHILCSNGEGSKALQIIMTYISPEEEQLIDSLEDRTLTIERGKRVFVIRRDKLFCYGEVNFNDENDLNIIENFKFLGHLGGVGIPFPYNYDYENHSCVSPNKRIQWTETWSPSVLAKYAHGKINKPERILLFKTR